MKRNGLMRKCKDDSDQIFQQESKCNFTSLFASNYNKYHKLFCTKNMLKNDVNNVCNNSNSFLNSNSKDFLHYVDPHNCRGSCAEPADGCVACSNSNYFSCVKNKVKVCFHPLLVCDGHPQCDDAEDEDIDMCHSRFVKKRIVSNYATLKCASRMYPQMITLATVCDGVPECHNDEDEPLSCDNTSPMWFYVSIGLITIIYSLLEIKTKLQSKRNKVDIVLEKNTFNESLFKKYSENHEKYLTLINSYLLFVKFTKSNRERVMASIKLYILEVKKHEHRESEIFCCLHNHLGPQVCEMVIDSNFPGFMAKNCAVVSSFLDILNRNGIYRPIMYHSAKLGGILGHYSDLTKDTFLFITIYKMNGGIKPLLDYPLNFTLVVVTCFGVSIVFPLLLTSIHLAKNNTQMIYAGWNCKATKEAFK